MKVSSLNVQEGEQVKKGELLFQVDLNTLKKKRSSLMTELEQAKLTKEDADSQAKTTQEKQEEEISHARENYAPGSGECGPGSGYGSAGFGFG